MAKKEEKKVVAHEEVAPASDTVAKAIEARRLASETAKTALAAAKELVKQAKADEKAARVGITAEAQAKVTEIDTQILALKAQRKALKPKGGGGGGMTGLVRPKSATGNYPTIRALMEEVFIANKDATFAEVEARVKIEFPTSAFQRTHYAWYKNKIVSHGEIKTKKAE